MNDERWRETVNKIKDTFEVVSERQEEFGQDDGPGSVEIIEFRGPLGLMKLERTTQPLVLGKKTIGSRRIGSQVTVEYQYSDSEKVHKFKAYRSTPSGQWVEMEIDRGEMNF